MSNTTTPSGRLHIFLWIAQVLLAASMAWSAYMKLLQPLATAAMWPWAGQVSPAFLRVTAVADLLGATGLVLPALLRIRPRLTPVAAIGVVVLMVCASVFHIARGEASSIGVNIVFALLAAFIAWGRLTKAPIAAKA